MKSLKNSELYKLYGGSGQKLLVAKQKLEKNIYVVSTTSHVEEQMLQLKNMKKNAYYPLMNQIFSMSQATDQVIPFAFETGEISQLLPFTAFRVGNTIKTYVNLFRIGKWNADQTKFSISSLDLYSCLESGIIAHLMLVHGMTDKVLNNNTVLETSARIYAKLFFKVLERAKKSINSEIYQDFTLYFIAKFFLKNILEKPDGRLVDDIAYKAIKNKTSFTAIQNMESSVKMDYSSLKGFLDSIGEFLDFGEITYHDLVLYWAKMYGESTVFMIEYYPFFIHFVFAGLRGSQTIGGLSRRRDEFEKDASRLYSAIVSILN